MSLKGKLIAGGLMVALLAAVGVQRKLICNARADNELLGGQTQPVSGRADATNFTAAEIEALRESIHELPALRNEVRQLRAQKADVERMQFRNQQLIAQLSATNQITARPPPTPEQGFVLNNTWAYAGLAVPEATIQTFFWAVRQQDLQTVLACFTPEIAQETGLVDETGQIRDSMREHLANSFGAMKAYRIAHTEQSSADKVKLDIQAAVNGQAITVSLRHIGQEWKIYRF